LPRNVDTYSGKVFIEGRDVMLLDDEDYRKNVRWLLMSLVPQAAEFAQPGTQVGEQVSEPAMIHLGVSKEEALALTLGMFQHVGIPADL